MSSDKLPSRPTLDIREALNELLRRNERTHGAEVGEMYLSSDLFVARLRRAYLADERKLQLQAWQLRQILPET